MSLTTSLAAGSGGESGGDAEELRDLAQRIVTQACARGASDAECVIRTGREFSATVRLGEVENLKEAGSKSLGIRVFRGSRAASTYTSDFGWPAIEHLINSALEIATIASEDPCAGLADAADLASGEDLEALAERLALYSPRASTVTTAEGIELARRCERAALDVDPRLTNSDGGSFESAEGLKVLVTSRGFAGQYRRSFCSIAAVPIATQDGQMQRDYWYAVARDAEGLESPESVGRKAAERTLRRLGARKVPTARVPVVFDPQVAQSLLDHVYEAANGESVYRGTSFLHDQLGKPIAATRLSVVDDGRRVGGFGSAPFDGEGVATRRTPVIEQGVLANFLLNSYTARKLQRRTTGNAARGLAGNPGIGVGNFYIEPGSQSPQEIIRSIPNGLYVTEFIGSGVNIVTGDYSRGASGLWIENGELTYPVEEITVAGNLKEMLRNIAAVGNDLVFRSSSAAPTLLLEGLTVAGV